ncbi:MAG: IS110 family transposase [Isosphaera sp.]|nr:IS110 family transposase [Isosphaera sp.]
MCCGIDVHKNTLTACLLTTGASGEVVQDVRTFRTVTAQLQELARWLRGAECPTVALESTGVYWRPVFNVLEPAGLEVVLANAQHVRNVPGRKTDVKDAEWLATLFRVGLLRGSFVPPKEIRELRDLTRYRTQVIRQRAQECNRIQKLLEDCNIKLAGVATDILGKSGRDMLESLGQGIDDPKRLADLARGKLRAKIPALEEALRGVLSGTQRWLLREQLHKVAELDEAIERLDVKVAESCLPFAEALAILDQIPGVNARIAQIIVAEIGLDMTRFKTASNLASWAGMCPGNRRSAGKSQGGKTRKGNGWLRQALVEAGWAASRSKGTSLSATYHRLAGRRGGKRACLAVGHRILRMVHNLLSSHRPYQEGGIDYYRPTDTDRLKDKLVQRLRTLGYAVTIAAAETAA